MDLPRRILLAVAALLILLGLSAVAVIWFEQSELWLPLRNTLLLCAVVCVISLPVGTLLALLIVRTDTPGRRTAAVLLVTMLLVPLYLQMTGWEAVVGKLGWQLGQYGAGAQPLLSGWRAVVWIHTLAAIPWVTLIVGLGLTLVDPQLEEESLLNATSGQVFLRIVLPGALPSLGVAALWVLTVSAGEMTVTNVYQVFNYAEVLHTWLAWGDDSGNMWQQLLPSLLLLALLLVAGLLLVMKLAPGGDLSIMRRPRQYRLGRWRLPAAALLCVLMIAMAVVPLAGLCSQAGKQSELLDGQPTSYWSAAKFIDMAMLNPWRRFGEDIGWTLLIGAAAATTALLLSAPLAWWARNGGRRALPALLVSALFLSIPGPLLSLGLIRLLSNPTLPLASWLLDQTIFTPVVLLAARGLPLAILICWYALRTVGRDTLDSAAIEGAGSTTRFWRIAASAHLPAFATAWLAAIAVAMGDVSTTANLLVLPPGVDTVAQRVFQLAHFGATDQLSGLALCSTFGFIAIALLLLVVLRRTRQ